ncbi:hypothetical protein AciM339_0084 [Aciduliprofundum sp. MAR08-339]|uniref:tRNA (pseudouridine(54)-N(1))-methyltransferase TrmY n=1 Tax=Aciduliprofundum sp. (strain MAR08-339) TaxID=673860 RepID=UPI0002A47C09|nr:hypothetical protein AciM339_0084 [Aciduliprofundum sp. MAR08-339]
MRSFLVVGHKFRGDINLNDLPGSGRIDVIARCINASIFLSHDIRRDVIFLAYFPQISARIKIDSSRVKYLNPDERSTAALIRNAIIKMDDEEICSSPGFYVKRESFREVIEEIKSLGRIYYLHEKGEDMRGIALSDKSAFILSDSVNFSPEEEKMILEFADARISVGPRSILASHTITIVHNELDRRGL